MTSLKLRTTALVLLLLLLNQDALCHRLALFPLRKRPSELVLPGPYSQETQLPLVSVSDIAAAMASSGIQGRQEGQEGGQVAEDSNGGSWNGEGVGRNPCVDAEDDPSCLEKPSLERSLIDLLYRMKTRTYSDKERKGLQVDRQSAQKRGRERVSSFYSNW